MELKVKGTGYVQNDFDDDELESESFGIDKEDEDVVVSILRDKIYSDPIKVLVQEYICNGRDSNVEANNPYNKLDIFVPNQAFTEFKVRDNGVGLSKEAIKRVYIKLGKSTKRKNKGLIGAYGLGSKSGFSYTDSFFITSWYNGMKYECLALVAENMKGDIKFLNGDGEPTDEPNGIEISVNLKDPEDVEKFRKAIFRTTAFWEEKPNYLNILDHEIESYIPKECYRDENILITERSSLVEDNKMILCDGVPYSFTQPVDSSSRLGFGHSYCYLFLTTNAVVKPAASREAITKGEDLDNFTNSTKGKIDKLADAHLEKIKKATSLSELNEIYNDVPFIPSYEDYKLDCMPDDVLFKGYNDIMIPFEYNLTYSSKGSTKWTHYAAYEYLKHEGRTIYIYNDSNSTYKTIARKLKNNSQHRYSSYLIFEKEPPEEFYKFFDICLYSDIKPKPQAREEVDDAWIRYYRLNTSKYTDTNYSTYDKSTEKLAVDGHYYAIMNGWRIKDYGYYDLEALETFIEDENKKLILISDKNLRSLSKIEGFNLKPVSEYKIELTERHKNAILKAEYEWLPSRDNLSGISRFSGYEELEEVVIGKSSKVDIDVLKEKFPTEYEQTVEEYKWVNKYKDDPLATKYAGLCGRKNEKDIDCDCYDEEEFEHDYGCKKCGGDGYYTVKTFSDKENFVKLMTFVQQRGVVVEANQITQ